MALQHTPWKGDFAPFKILGNLYFVGTEGASTHIVDTGEGLIMFDSGYQESLYLVIHHMNMLGLDIRDVKYIFHTHGHIDHAGATAALKKITDAKAAIGKEDREYVNGERDLSYAKELDMEMIFFEPDILLSDGDVITLGKTSVRAVATPGHTEGAMSYIFNVNDGDKEYIAGLHGGMGINTMNKAFLDKYGLSYDCRDKFRAAMDRLKEEKVDIFLGNHMQHNNTPSKYKEILSGNKDAFINEKEWAEYAEWAKNNLIRMMEDEK